MAVTFALTLTTSAASAQGQSDEERARQHFAAGRSHFEEGSYEAAITEFQQAYDLSQRPGLLYNLALAHERLARYAEAAALIRRYLAEDPDAQNRSSLERRAENLEQRAAAGQEGDDVPRDPEGSGHPAPMPIGTIVSFSGAGAGLILYGIAGGLLLDAYSRVENGCGATMDCEPEEVSDVRTFAALADVGLAVAIAGAALGVVFLVVELGGGSNASASALRITPIASADSAGVLVGGAF